MQRRNSAAPPRRNPSPTSSIRRRQYILILIVAIHPASICNRTSVHTATHPHDHTSVTAATHPHGLQTAPSPYRSDGAFIFPDLMVRCLCLPQIFLCSSINRPPLRSISRTYIVQASNRCFKSLHNCMLDPPPL
ncbi:hypothetical protein LINPERHAP1_LOCUS22561 [Linum perenne]